MYKYIEQGSYGGCLASERIICMEYYAKSKKVQFTSERINEIKKNMKNIEECLKENLTETDVEILNSSITDIAEKTEEKQKTLKEHHKDIVTCAEMFFLEYGEYFTEKEKKLVVEACRIHDLGKVNLVFQAMICPKLAEKFHIDVRKTQQIPHGFLSAVTISLDEFDDLSELFSDKDFGPFITAVYYHHDREDHYNSPAIRKYAEKYYMKQIEEYLNRKIRKLNCSNLDDLLFRNNVYTGKYIPDSNAWKEYLLIKGLLNKFDYTVSAGYENAESAIDLHEKKLVKNIEKFLNGKELRPAQKFMKMNRDKNLIVIAPTGSGKTEASLLWMNGEKSFYTLPLKVSSNAIYLRIKESLLAGQLLVKQVENYTDYEKRMILAKKFIEAAADNIYRNLRYYNGRGKDVAEYLRDVDSLRKQIGKTKTIEELMGVEGNIRRRYYAAWNVIVNQEIKFEKRVMHPPDNMINSLISFVNTLIYTKVLSEIYHTQLNPTISYLHEPGVRRFSLSLDIAEVFKPLIGDRVIFSLLNRKQITEDSFTKELNFLHLKKDASKLIVSELEKRLKQSVMHKDLGRQVSYQYLLRLESYKLIKHLIGEKEYEGFRIWW